MIQNAVGMAVWRTPFETLRAPIVFVPGGAATFIDLADEAGWVAESMYLHYGGDASGSRRILIAGTAVANLRADSDAFLFGGLYTFDLSPLHAHYSVGAFLPRRRDGCEGEGRYPARHVIASGSLKPVSAT